MSVSSVLSAFFVAFVIAFRLIVPQLSAATDIVVDNKIYGELLEKYVRNGKVNYAGFKAEEAKLDRYLKILENVNIAKLSRDEQ
ncbi:MAG: DUF547 domain-containing protein, partial [Desulfobacterales bacterium]